MCASRSHKSHPLKRSVTFTDNRHRSREGAHFTGPASRTQGGVHSSALGHFAKWPTAHSHFIKAGAGSRRTWQYRLGCSTRGVAHAGHTTSRRASALPTCAAERVKQLRGRRGGKGREGGRGRYGAMRGGTVFGRVGGKGGRGAGERRPGRPRSRRGPAPRGTPAARPPGNSAQRFSPRQSSPPKDQPAPPK